MFRSAAGLEPETALTGVPGVLEGVRMKRFLPFCLALGLFLCWLPVCASTATPAEYDKPYGPLEGLEKYQEDTGQTEVHPNNSSIKGQCVWFVKAVRTDLPTAKIVTSGNGDAWEWYDYFRHNLHWKAGDTPKPGAIMCFGKGKDSSTGHLAIIRAVNPDGTLDVWDSNYGFDGKVRKRRIATTQPLLQGYLYGQDSEQPPVSWASSEGVARAESANGRLYPIRENGKWGFIDSLGHVVVQPKYDSVGEFSEGFAAVCLGAKWGYLNGAGQVVIKPLYQEAEPFSEGLALVTLRRDIKRVALPSYGAGSPAILSEYAWIDGRGNITFRKKLLSASSFSGGYTLVQREDFTFVYVDRKGVVAFGRAFTFASDFSECLARVSMILSNKGQIPVTETVHIDTNGQPVIYDDRLDFGECRDFSEGLAMVDVDGRRGYIDTTGTFAIKPQFGTDRSCGDFHDGYASIECSNGKYRYIGKNGRFLKGEFERADAFSEGLAAVRRDGRWGYIDTTGKVVIQPRFSVTCKFHGGLAWVKLSDSKDIWQDRAYINRNGEVVWKSAN